jgi:DNA-binding winged helix-turn-helix (wHTH) protein
MNLQLIERNEQREQTRREASAMTKRQASLIRADVTLTFGRFRALLRRRQLLVDEVPVEIGTRAFDLLMVLIDAGGLLVTKDELMSRVWPGIVVDESNLRVQISALRKALGKDCDLVRTEIGRGYRFTASIRSVAAAPDASSTLEAMLVLAGSKTVSPTDLPTIVAQLAHVEAQLAKALDLLTHGSADAFRASR